VKVQLAVYFGIFDGSLFLGAFPGLAIGAGTGAITGPLSDNGQCNFIKEVGATIKPDGSAMFLLISKWTEDKAPKRLKKFNQKSSERPFKRRRT
jgi:uncharacterized membrane protein